MKSDPVNYIFTEDLDYSKTPKTSIWGRCDTLTVQELSKLSSSKSINGNWLHVAAGDGRYNDILLESADSVTATDIDDGALKKLLQYTNSSLSNKLHIQTQDITKQFPFDNETFDGVFNTGTLHLFPEEILRGIMREVARILKPNGIFMFDFATDITRLNSDGSYIGSPNLYYKDSAKNILERMLSKNNFDSRFLFDTVPPETVISSAGEYTFTCNFWLNLSRVKK